MADVLRREIELVNAKFMEHFKNQDPEGIARLYTEDCKIMPTGADVMTGQDAVAGVFASVMTAGGATVLLAVDEVGPMGSDTAYERSHYTFSKDDGTVFDHGKYVVIWKRVAGIWNLYIDIFNTNTS